MQKSRNLDIIRSLAIFSVVVCHVTESAYPITYKVGLWEYSRASHLFGVMSFTFGRLGVPLFFFLTGYLLLGRDYSGDKALSFYRTKLLPLYLTTVGGVSLLTLFEIWRGGTFSLERYIKQCLFMEGLPGIQTWYMPVIIMMYLWLPFIAQGLKTITIETLKLPLLLVFIYFFLSYDINRISYLIGVEFSLIPKVNFGFVTEYGVYLLFGWLLSKGAFKHLKKWTLIIILAFATTSVVLIQYLGETEYAVWYNDAFILVSAICLFELLSRLPEKRSNKDIFYLIARNSFGIYWVHSIVLGVFKSYEGNSYTITGVKGVLFFSPLVLVISLIIVYVYKKAVRISVIILTAKSIKKKTYLYQ